MKKLLYILLLLPFSLKAQDTAIIYGQQSKLFLDSIKQTQWFKDTIAKYGNNFTSTCITDSVTQRDSITKLNDTAISYSMPMYIMTLDNLNNMAFQYVYEIVLNNPAIYALFSKKKYYIIYKKHPF